MSKKLHVNAFPVDKQWAEEFRQVVRSYNAPATYEEHQANGYVEPEPVVEILYEESNQKFTHFDLWFATPSTGFYFSRNWARREQELLQQTELATYKAQVAAELRQLLLQAIHPSFDRRFERHEDYRPAEAYLDELAARLGVSTGPPAYPQFLYHSKLRTWLRYNSAEYFCLVSESQLQVRRERPQELFKLEEVQVVSEAAFLEAYRHTSRLLRERAEQHLATYQRRGSEGNEWFYCRLIYAGGATDLQKHLRLNVSSSAHGRSWQLLYDYDRHWNDARRVASTEPEFAQQLSLLLQEAEAAATGQEGGPAA